MLSRDIRLMKLSKREREVLRLMAQGVPDKAIAEALRIKPSTVRTYISRLRIKFDVSNRAQLGAMAATLGGSR